MIDTNILTVPVYRLGRDDYYSKMESFIEKQMFQGNEENVDRTKKYYKKYPRKEYEFRDHLTRRFGGAWKFNEIIGFIELYFMGSQIRGKYWRVDAKKIVKSRRKQFQRVTHKLAPEINIPFDSSDTQVFECICRYLDDCKKELKGRYIDREEFLSIGPYIKWNELYRQRP